MQFIHNKALRLWMDERGVGWAEQQRLCAQLAKEYPFAARLHSNAQRASADRAWASISRFYKNCREKKPGKKGHPRFQKDNRSVEYKVGGWKLEPDGKRLTFTDGTGMGTMRLIGTRKQQIETFPVQQIKRVRLVKRADGYYVQFALQAERTIAHEATFKQVGIDVGLKAFYTDSDGATVANPRYLRKAERSKNSSACIGASPAKRNGPSIARKRSNAWQKAISR